METTQDEKELQELRDRIGSYIVGKADWLMFRQGCNIADRGGRLTYYGLKYARNDHSGEREVCLVGYIEEGNRPDDVRVIPLTHCANRHALTQVLDELTNHEAFYTAPHNRYHPTEKEQISAAVRQVDRNLDIIRQQVTEIVKMLKHVQTDPFHVEGSCGCSNIEWKDGEVILHTGVRSLRLSELTNPETIYNLGKVFAEGKYQQFQGYIQG